MSAKENDRFQQLLQELTGLLDDLANERFINAQKLKHVAPGDYPYGEGMHDGLNYAAEGLAKILRRHQVDPETKSNQ